MKTLKKLLNHRYYLHVLFDFLLLLITFQIAYFIHYGTQKTVFILDIQYVKLFVIMLPSWILAFHITKVAHLPRTSNYSRLFFEFSQFLLLSITFLIITPFVLKFENINSQFLILFSGLSLFMIFGIRFIEYNFLKVRRIYDFNNTNILLIADDSAVSFIENLIANKQKGYRVVTLISDSEVIKHKFSHLIKVFPMTTLQSIQNMVEFDIIDEVIYFRRSLEPTTVKHLLKTCEEIGIVLRIKSDIVTRLITNAKHSKIADISFLTFVVKATDSISMVWKSFFDVFLSFFLIITLCPVFIIIALNIKLSSPGPIFFKQLRVGYRNRQFYLYKFRTMVVNAEQLRKDLETENEMDGPVFKIKNDPRITTIGKILRKTGLDELPQLLNVLKGEMSLIGPRPPLQAEIRQYERWQLRRLSVKPGITCSWQIIPDRNNVKFDKWMKLDLAYIDNWSLRLDFVLLLKTIKTVLFGTGA